MDLKFKNEDVDVYVPDGASIEEALARTTNLAMVAHQDDDAIAAFHGVSECYNDSDGRWFTAVVLTNGGGSARAGIYANTTDKEMQGIRRAEQRRAADRGAYSAVIQLAYPSSIIKDAANAGPDEDLLNILQATGSLEKVYMHNLLDKHPTHIACAMRSIRAMRLMPPASKPKKVYGCEVWRGLDWMLDDSKVVLPVDAHPKLARELLSLYRSQVEGGKDYVEAELGRRRANATYYNSHEVDAASMISFAMDLSLLVDDSSLDIKEFALQFIDQFRAAAAGALNPW